MSALPYVLITVKNESPGRPAPLHIRMPKGYDWRHGWLSKGDDVKLKQHVTDEAVLGGHQGFFGPNQSHSFGHAVNLAEADGVSGAFELRCGDDVVGSFEYANKPGASGNILKLVSAAEGWPIEVSDAIPQGDVLEATITVKGGDRSHLAEW